MINQSNEALMKIKKLIIIITLLVYHNFKAMVPAGTDLKNFNYTGASVLPMTSWAGKPGVKYVLLSEEAHGRDKGTWDDFGGAKDPYEIDPLQTAAREAWEESVNLLTKNQNFLTNYISLSANNTQDVIASIDKQMVTYITNFESTYLEHLTKNFHSKLRRTTDPHQTEKSRLAWVKYDDLKNVIANAPRNATGQLIAPIRVTANIINPADPSVKGQIRGQQIPLRLVFVSKLQEFFKDAPYVQGQDPRIKFFKRGYVTPVPAKPVIPIPLKPVITLKYEDYTYASVLPVTSWPSGDPKNKILYVLLSQEAVGNTVDTWSDFVGKKKPGEKNAAETASLGAWQESVNLLMNSPQEIAEFINSDKTMDVIISADKHMVTFISKFFPASLDKIAKEFYSKRSQTNDPKLRTKKALAWVKYDDLKTAIKNSSRDSKDVLITPIQVPALVIDPKNTVTQQEPKGNYTLIDLRPLFVSKLQEYFKGSLPYKEEAPNIKFFKRIIAPTPISKEQSIDSLSNLYSTLSSLSDAS